MTKRIVEYVRPVDKYERPYYIVLSSTHGQETDLIIQRDITAVNHIVNKFDSRYLVKAENASPEVPE